VLELVGGIIAPLFFVGGIGVLLVSILHNGLKPEKRREYRKLGLVMLLIGVALAAVQFLMFGTLLFFL